MIYPICTISACCCFFSSFSPCLVILLPYALIAFVRNFCILSLCFMFFLISCILATLLLAILDCLVCNIYYIVVLVGTEIILTSFQIAICLDVISCITCGQLPNLPIDLLKDINANTILSLFGSRVRFMTNIYLNLFKKELEKYRE